MSRSTASWPTIGACTWGWAACSTAGASSTAGSSRSTVRSASTRPGGPRWTATRRTSSWTWRTANSPSRARPTAACSIRRSACATPRREAPPPGTWWSKARWRFRSRASVPFFQRASPTWACRSRCSGSSAIMPSMRAWPASIPTEPTP